MLPIGPLMKEHRVIERMIALVASHCETIRETGQVDVAFIDTAVDFIRTYADRCHHGKEEDIVFRALAGKALSPGHKRTMAQLMEDHRSARRTVAALVEARKRHVDGDSDAVNDIAEHLATLVGLYPGHIETEDKHFFIPVMKYLSDEEKDALVQEGFAFDRDLIHEKYRDIVETLEVAAGPE